MNELPILSWNQFMKFADQLDVGSVEKSAYLFRGHADTKWHLQPSLLRYSPSGSITEDKALKLEQLALKEFRGQAHLHLPPNVLSTTTDTVSWWTLMQHHGAPTRLLDWSMSIYVAAYFAVMEELDTDGAIWLVHIDSVDKQQEKQTGPILLPKTSAEMDKQFCKPDAPPTIFFTHRISKIDRMIPQQAVFTVCRNILRDHGQIFTELLPENSELELFRKLVIPANLKLNIARKLRSMNITANTLFPGLDGLGRSIRQLIQIGAREDSK